MSTDLYENIGLVVDGHNGDEWFFVIVNKTRTPIKD
jgi:hypothetical protein